jgi:hypothetical protein
MRALLITLALASVAMPAVAGGISFDLPTLTWPQDDVTNGSTKGCAPVQGSARPACK